MTDAGATAPDASGRATTPWCAVVVNPVKAPAGVEDLVRLITTGTEEAGWAPPKIWETTAEDPGAGQAREALDAGASLVVAAGGDGTTRAVAGVLAGSGVPMGLLPMGTGNLLARNLGVPLHDAEAAVRVITRGETRGIDLVRARITRPDGSTAVEPSVVMLGMGFDAEVVGETDDTLKRTIGWGAYVAAGLRRLMGGGRRHPVRLWLDNDPPRITRVRSVLVASAGTLTGGVRLLREAKLDDGLADVVTVTPKSVAGWIQIIWWAVRGAGGSNPLVQQRQVHKVRVDARWPMPAQVDGDVVGAAIRLDVTVEPLALLVRTPSQAPGRAD
ncbi:MAG: diacylglycerol/lipid kinase family protein [Kineosporiaceae bacterium]